MTLNAEQIDFFTVSFQMLPQTRISLTVEASTSLLCFNRTQSGRGDYNKLIKLNVSVTTMVTKKEYDALKERLRTLEGRVGVLEDKNGVLEKVTYEKK